MKAFGEEDKTTVRDFWKKLNNTDDVDNIAESWDEVKPSTSNSAWKSIWPDYIHDIISFPQADILHQIWNDIVILAKDVGFEEVIENDRNELLVSQKESLTES